MNDPLMPFIWAAAALVCLILMQRWIHTHLHGISLLLVGRADWAVIVYAVVLFPGVVLHEASHWLMATLLGVRTGKMSLLPRRQADGSLQLGYVEYYKGPSLGPARESLIGAAPLISGTAVILLIGHHIFGVTSLADAVRAGDVAVLGHALAQALDAPNALVWLYLVFAISSAMLPSRSDRHAWPAFLAIMAVVLAVVAYLGRNTGLIDGLARPVTVLLGYLGTAFSIAIAVGLVCMALIAAIEWTFGRIRGVSVVYGRDAD
ncbi:MAG: hypothetical protein LC131_11810 [Anaerolineae bacterium]|nr:hypothetical protein [Anaerolineae bacterium]